MKHPPIAVMSFNRPDYLREVLSSLAAQKDAEIEQRAVFLFQDGWRNAFSGRMAAEEADVVACIAVFREIFPKGHVMASPTNLGVAENFYRAETLFFREMKADCAYFFEDDLVLAPNYLRTMDALRDASAPSGRVGYFACYGDLMASEDDQRAQARALRRIGHFWGFGLFRSHWEDMQPLMQDFYDMVLGVDYKNRPHDRIKQVYRGKDILIGVTSQDDVKKAVTYKLGRVGLNTVMVSGRYIGAVGLHMNAKKFEERGYGKTVMLGHDRMGFDFPAPHQLDAMVREELSGRAQRIAQEPAPQKPAVPAAAPRPPAKLGAPRMKAEDRDLFERILASGKRNYAEFGVGGSTVLAMKHGFDAIVGVDSDPVWARTVRQHPEVAPAILSSKASILHADIGPVSHWGRPADRDKIERWPRYVATMWTEWAQRGTFPDLVLVDGRFRVASALSVAIAHAMRREGPPPLVLVHGIPESHPAHPLLREAFDLSDQAGQLCVLTPRREINAPAVLALMISRLTDVG